MDVIITTAEPIKVTVTCDNPNIIEVVDAQPVNVVVSLVKDGKDGAKGDKGDKGDTGEQGIQGIQGVQGEKGDKGDTGEQGIQGIQGVQGEKGDKGDTGEQGIQGVQGVQGVQGIQGPAGIANVQQNVGNADTAINTGTTKIVTNAALTANRIYTLPATSNVLIPIEFIDEFQAIGTYSIEFKVQTGKKLNGVVNGSIIIKAAGAGRRFWGDGNGNYVYDAGIMRYSDFDVSLQGQINNRICIITDTVGGAVVNAGSSEVLIYSFPIPAGTLPAAAWGEFSCSVERLSGGSGLGIVLYSSTSPISLGNQFAYFGSSVTTRYTFSYEREFKIISNQLDPNKWPVGSSSLSNKGTAVGGGTPTTVPFNPVVNMWIHVAARHTTNPGDIQILNATLKYK